MRRSKHWTELRREERGSASLEFITAGVLLLVPMVYLVLAMAQLQAGTLAAEGAARQAARVFVQAPDVATASASAHRAIEFTLRDYGVDAAAATVEIRCRPEPADCLQRRGVVTVRVVVPVALPLASPALEVDAPLSVTLEASATQRVSRFGAAP